MINPKIESFLEKVNMNYLYCLLAKLEAHRIHQLPSYVKQKFENKIPVMAMEHVAENEVPDYLTELAEAELAMAAERAAYEEDDDMMDMDAETIDDSKKFIEDIQNTEFEGFNGFDDDEDEDNFVDTDDDDD
jgi:hypothetical protein